MSSTVLYLEVDEDITSAIDKLGKSNAASVSIVAPKRSALIQSLINLKLLQKAAKDNGQELILVTGDRTATHLASRLGIAVAATLKTGAQVPQQSTPEPDDDAVVLEDDPDDDTTSDSAAEALTSLASPITASQLSRTPIMTSRPVGDYGDLVVNQYKVDTEGPNLPKIPHASTRVPNFSSMQKKLLIAGGVAIAIAALIITNMIITSAKVTIFAKGTGVATDFNFTLDTTSGQSDIVKKSVVSQSLSVAHQLTAPVAATGKKDIGTKATGTVTIYNEYDAASHSLPAGTKFIATDGKVFVSTEAAVVPGLTVIILPGPTFSTKPGASGPIAVEAANSGDGYNLAAGKYSITGQPDKIYAQGKQMTGGSSKQVDIITAADIDAAKKAALDKDKPLGQKEVVAKAATGYKSLDATFAISTGEATASPAIDSQASTGTVSLSANYTILAYNVADLAAVAKSEQERQLGEGNQIYDNGAVDAKLSVPGASGSGVWTIHYATTAYAGAKLDTSKIAKTMAGKRYGDAADIGAKLPGVERVEITLWPAWASKLPRITKNIHISVKVTPK